MTTHLHWRLGHFLARLLKTTFMDSMRSRTCMWRKLGLFQGLPIPQHLNTHLPQFKLLNLATRCLGICVHPEDILWYCFLLVTNPTLAVFDLPR